MDERKQSLAQGARSVTPRYQGCLRKLPSADISLSPSAGLEANPWPANLLSDNLERIYRFFKWYNCPCACEQQKTTYVPINFLSIFHQSALADGSDRARRDGQVLFNAKGDKKNYKKEYELVVYALLRLLSRDGNRSAADAEMILRSRK
jgi:hypothetical protein